MADRWSNPSGSVGFNRFRVWPAGSDSYSHVDLTNNWDELDAIIGNSPDTNWPPTLGLNGGIYGVIQALTTEVGVVAARQPVLFGLYSARPSAGSVATGTVYVATDVGGVFQMTGTSWILIAQQAVSVTEAQLALLTPYDGQVIDLTDDLVNSTYKWRLQYNASRGDQYKWAFVGGSSLFGSGSTGTVVPGWSVRPGSLALTPPRSGIYDVEGEIHGSFPSGSSINVVFGQTNDFSDFVTVGTGGSLSQVTGVTVFVDMQGGVAYNRTKTLAGDTPVQTWISGSPEQILYLGGGGQAGGNYVGAAATLRLTPRFLN